jgi:hypothetical protein
MLVGGEVGGGAGPDHRNSYGIYMDARRQRLWRERCRFRWYQGIGTFGGLARRNVSISWPVLFVVVVAVPLSTPVGIDASYANTYASSGTPLHILVATVFATCVPVVYGIVDYLVSGTMS